jgi:hypothetical protein
MKSIVHHINYLESCPKEHSSCNYKNKNNTVQSKRNSQKIKTELMEENYNEHNSGFKKSR